MNTLYYGDNLQVLRTHIADESVDLVYLDPPFNSGRDYNAVFEDGDSEGKGSTAQVQAFTDTWKWDETSARAYAEVIRGASDGASVKLSETMKAFRVVLGDGSTLAYLSMMAPRLVELRRVLKPTGSLYLHCDPTASHYLKMLLDGIFGRENFRNEIVWHYGRFSRNAKIAFPSMHDVILFYAKGKNTYNAITTEPKSAERYQKGYHTVVDGGKRKLLVYDEAKCKAAGVDFTKYDEIKPTTALAPILDDVWDIPFINPVSKERLGYPTQKPRALLERILKASSNEGDVVLDPFCGCGTALDAAVVLNRKWIGIDITHVATNVIKKRLEDVHGLLPKKDYLVVGEPKDLAGAQQLAEDDPHQFQTWALGLVGARTEAGPAKKGGDKGIDGVKVFATSSGDIVRCLISVKGGQMVSSGVIRDLRGTLEREKAAMGLLITLKAPSRGMVTEALTADFYEPEGMDAFVGDPIPRIQIASIEDLLAGKLPRWPAGLSMTDRTIKKAKRD